MKHINGIPLWNTQATPILWINEGLDRKRHLELRGLDEHMFRNSFATANRAEAIHRQKMIKLFLENGLLRRFVLEDYFRATNDRMVIPKDGQAFLNYFNPQQRNEFWELLEQFVGITSSAGNIQEHPALFEMVKHFKHEQARLETLETKMGSTVIEQLVKATTVDCTITLQLGVRDGGWRFTVIGKEAVGHRLYALNPPNENEEVPEWATNEFCREIGLYKWWNRRIEKRKQRRIRKWAKPIILNECPYEIVQDVCAFMNGVLQEEKEGEKSSFPVPEEGTGLVDIVIRVSYRGDGLKIKLVGLSTTQTVPNNFEERWAMPSDNNWFRYYSSNERSRIDTMQTDIRRRSYITHLLTNYYPRLKLWFEKKLGSFVTEDGLTIESPNSDDQFKWVHAETLCRAEWAETYASSLAIRSFASEHMHTLVGIAQIAETFLTKSKEWNLPISFPEIVEGDTATLSFDTLWPVSLIGRKTSGSKGKPIRAKDLRPITALGNLAGGISMLTGGNGAGKTTTGEELLGVLHDAASGFPVFGQNVKLNLRTVIGSIYLERGDGSTMQLSMVKLANVLNEVAEHPMNGTFVFWDEAGTGTSASQGERLGLATLGRLREIGCTVLVNTQIPSLAENAQLKLNAKCFQVDMGHRIKPGIGEPDIVELAREMGLDKALNLKN